MLREGLRHRPITVCADLRRRSSRAQIELLKTFADQAVIAVENVRLFKELRVRNRDQARASSSRRRPVKC